VEFPAGFSSKYGPFLYSLSPTENLQPALQDGIAMSQPLSEQSSLTRLVVVIACLALAGSFVAVMHYYVVDQPRQQAALNPPLNAGGASEVTEKCNTCLKKLWDCQLECREKHNGEIIAVGLCYNWCDNNAATDLNGCQTFC
jgi:hypothetical protein